jgi:exonuclease SbcD
MLKRGGEILEEPDGENHCVLEMPISFIRLHSASNSIYGFGALASFSECRRASKSCSIQAVHCPIFSEAGQEKKVVLIEAKPNEAVKYTGIPLQSGRTLHRKRFETIDNAVEWLLENYCLVELTLVSDTFFLTQDLKRIHESHDGIIYIIPIVTKDGNAEQQTQK